MVLKKSSMPLHSFVQHVDGCFVGHMADSKQRWSFLVLYLLWRVRKRLRKCVVLGKLVNNPNLVALMYLCVGRSAWGLGMPSVVDKVCTWKAEYPLFHIIIGNHPISLTWVSSLPRIKSYHNSPTSTAPWSTQFGVLD